MRALQRRWQDLRYVEQSQLRHLQRLRLIPDNPAADVKLRRIESTTNVEEMHVLELDQLLTLFERAKAGNYKRAPYELCLLAFDSGARRGEYLASRWIDLDMERRTLRIERAVDETKAYGVRIKNELKNKHSKRIVTLSVQTVTALRSLWKRQAETYLRLGTRMPDDALIFPQDINTPTEPMRPREVSNAFKRLVERAGFDGFRLHDMRHSCASHMLGIGRPVPDVAKHLGHASPQVTMSVYAHAIPKAEGGLGLLDEIAPIAGAAE